MIENELIRMGFKMKNNTYSLSIGSHIMSIKSEFRINERYSAREYQIQSKTLNRKGIIYTNNIEYFKLTLTRLINEFKADCFPKNNVYAIV